MLLLTIFQNLLIVQEILIGVVKGIPALFGSPSKASNE